MPSAPMAQTRRATLDACRRALRENVGRFREVTDELFIVNNYIVRPKGTGTAEEDWVWDPGEPGILQPVREDFYLLHDVNRPDEFFVVPSEYVRGALEGAHYQAYLEGFRADELDGSAVNDRNLERNTMRRLRKWPVRHFKSAWRLLGNTDESLSYSDVSFDNDQSRPALLARGYTECSIANCRRLIKDMARHVEAHQSGLLDENGLRTDDEAKERQAKREATIRGGNSAKPIRDTATGKEYGSESKAGKDLYGLIDGDPKDDHVWFKILRKFPNRFLTKNSGGQWVPLDDPTAPKGSTRPAV